MKFTFLFNQAGIFDAGLADKTDFNDWAIMEYISEWQVHGSAFKIDGFVWMDYKHLLEQMPMLSVRSKSGLSNRVKKLRELNLLDSFQNEEFKLFVKVTDFYSSIVYFRPDITFSDSEEKKTVKRAVSVGGSSTGLENPSVHFEERGVPENERGVPESERAVPESEHIINNHLINNQYKTTVQEFSEKNAKAKQFADEVIFSEPMQWVEFFIAECAYPLHIVQTSKTIPLFASWVKDKVDVGVIRQAMLAANAWNGGRVPDSPVLYGRFLRSVQDESKQLGEDATFANRKGVGKARAVKADWEKVPRDDESLWPWAKKHGFKDPGRRSYFDYRGFLFSEVEKRRNSEAA